MARGLSLAEVAALTRIPSSMIQSLEADCLDEFRADVFLYGHIRSYAREVGLDGEALVRQMSRSVAPAQPIVQEPVSRVRDSFSRPRLSKAHMFAVVLVLAGLGLFVSLLSAGRATAKDPVKFEAAQTSAWELEQDTQGTRWLLEQPGK